MGNSNGYAAPHRIRAILLDNRRVNPSRRVTEHEVERPAAGRQDAHRTLVIAGQGRRGDGEGDHEGPAYSTNAYAVSRPAYLLPGRGCVLCTVARGAHSTSLWQRRLRRDRRALLQLELLGGDQLPRLGLRVVAHGEQQERKKIPLVCLRSTTFA